MMVTDTGVQNNGNVPAAAPLARRSALEALQPPPGAPVRAWVTRITACWRGSVELILEAGRLLTAAKELLPHGAFGQMMDAELPFSASTADRLMKIAADTRISDPAHVQYLPPSWGTLYELTKLDDVRFKRGIADGTIHPDMYRRDILMIEGASSAPSPIPESAPAEGGPEAYAAAAKALRAEADRLALEAAEKRRVADEYAAQLPNHLRVIGASRQEPESSPDFFPTGPVATRALMAVVLPHLGITEFRSACEPACGEGHMAEALAEFFDSVFASDKFEYGYGQGGIDFTLYDPPCEADWYITNPPFGDEATKFMLRALDLAKVGVAMFLQLRYLEGVDRYNQVFRDRPPTLVAPFVERVPLHKGRWEPDGGTMTAYCWLVWVRDMPPRPTFWIPPGQHDALTLPDDRERFTASPVLRRRVG